MILEPRPVKKRVITLNIDERVVEDCSHLATKYGVSLSYIANVCLKYGLAEILEQGGIFVCQKEQ